MKVKKALSGLLIAAAVTAPFSITTPQKTANFERYKEKVEIVERRSSFTLPVRLSSAYAEDEKELVVSYVDKITPPNTNIINHRAVNEFYDNIFLKHMEEVVKDKGELKEKLRELVEKGEIKIYRGKYRRSIYVDYRLSKDLEISIRLSSGGLLSIAVGPVWIYDKNIRKLWEENTGAPFPTRFSKDDPLTKKVLKFALDYLFENVIENATAYRGKNGEAGTLGIVIKEVKDGKNVYTAVGAIDPKVGNGLVMKTIITTRKELDITAATIGNYEDSREKGWAVWVVGVSEKGDRKRRSYLVTIYRFKGDKKVKVNEVEGNNPDLPDVDTLQLKHTPLIASRD